MSFKIQISKICVSKISDFKTICSTTDKSTFYTKRYFPRIIFLEGYAAFTREGALRAERPPRTENRFGRNPNVVWDREQKIQKKNPQILKTKSQPF